MSLDAFVFTFINVAAIAFGLILWSAIYRYHLYVITNRMRYRNQSLWPFFWEDFRFAAPWGGEERGERVRDIVNSNLLESKCIHTGRGSFRVEWIQDGDLYGLVGDLLYPGFWGFLRFHVILPLLPSAFVNAVFWALTQ